MENKTKAKILEEALVSFANKGYKGTNLRDLAADLGLTKSALYRYFDSKEAIWNAVLDMMESYYSERFGASEMLPELPRTCEELFSMTMRMIDFTVNDRKVILTRRLLLTEQFRDERARSLACVHFLLRTKDVFTPVFAQLMESGALKKGDPEMLAFAYTSPVSALIQQCDREPEKKQEIIGQIEAFVRHFMAVYS